MNHEGNAEIKDNQDNAAATCAGEGTTTAPAKKEEPKTEVKKVEIKEIELTDEQKKAAEASADNLDDTGKATIAHSAAYIREKYGITCKPDPMKVAPKEEDKGLSTTAVVLIGVGAAILGAGAAIAVSSLMSSDDSVGA